MLGWRFQANAGRQKRCHWGLTASHGSAYAATANAHEWKGQESPGGAHTPTELYTDAEDGEGEISPNAGDGGLGNTSPGMAVQRGPAPTNADVILSPVERPGGIEGQSSGNAVEYGESACMAPANAGAANSAVDAGDGERGGAPHQCNGGIVLHPDAIAYNSAFWDQLGDPYGALALGGG